MAKIDPIELADYRQPIMSAYKNPLYFQFVRVKNNGKCNK